MKNTYITIIVLVVILIGAWYLLGMNKQAEAPVVGEGENKAVPVNTSTDTSSADTILDLNADVKTTVGAVKEFTVTGKNFSFSPSVISVKKGDTVKITFKNGDGTHDFKIDEFKVATNVIKTGQEQTVEFVADKTGSFQYYCSIGSHRAMGMWGTLKVE
ncbi:MAG TPA: cupredoxin domain-containing protein [Candidatus Paceibacterota bacterium]